MSCLWSISWIVDDPLDDSECLVGFRLRFLTFSRFLWMKCAVWVGLSFFGLSVFFFLTIWTCRIFGWWDDSCGRIISCFKGGWIILWIFFRMRFYASLILLLYLLRDWRWQLLVGYFKIVLNGWKINIVGWLLDYHIAWLLIVKEK